MFELDGTAVEAVILARRGIGASPILRWVGPVADDVVVATDEDNVAPDDVDVGIELPIVLVLMGARVVPGRTDRDEVVVEDEMVLVDWAVAERG